MDANPLQISLDTLIGVAPMLGHELADHRAFRERQDAGLIRAIQAQLNDLCQTAQHLAPADAVVLVASSGLEDDEAPRRNRALHEKILYVDALQRGFELDERPARVFTMTQLAKAGEPLPGGQPV